MTYHLKNKDFLLDLICCSPELVHDNIILDSIRESFGGIPEKGIDRTYLKEVTCTRTQEGFEACLLLNLEGEHPAFNPRDLPVTFDKFLQNVDERLEGWKNDFNNRRL